MEGRRALFNNLFREVKAILNSSWDDEKQEGVPPSAWKVVVAFTHGDAKGGVTMHPMERGCTLGCRVSVVDPVLLRGRATSPLSHVPCWTVLCEPCDVEIFKGQQRYILFY